VPARELAFVALGSNLGDRDAALRLARDRLGALPQTTLVAASRVEETAPLGPIRQGRFLNQMVMLSTALTPRELLDHCLAIEEEAGRTREARWGPRTLDLDIVRFGDREVDEAGLTVPHPELINRAFWQRELAELEQARSGGEAPTDEIATA
jgi:2-amino-4-hydroxy-6-hydroxymethyldihydropteridine diphosphokinase